IHFGVFYFFLNRPKTQKILKKKFFFLVFVIQFCK
ncbi:unnamed protein product, partial [Staurois parvus]